MSSTKRSNRLIKVSEIKRIHQVHLEESEGIPSGHCLLLVPDGFEDGLLAQEIEGVDFELLLGGSVIDVYAPFEVEVEMDQIHYHIVAGLIHFVETDDLLQWVSDHFPHLERVTGDNGDACWVVPQLVFQRKIANFNINPRQVVENYNKKMAEMINTSGDSQEPS